MHDYSIDKHPKEKILFLLALLAIVAAPILQSGVDFLGMKAGLGKTSAIVITVFSVFAVLYWLFDRHLWKAKLLRRYLLVPDLNGTWHCLGQTALKNGKPVDYLWDAKITISQSWSKVLIHLQTQQSGSKSVSASIHHDKGVGYRVLYQYANEPNADEIDLNKHSGACELLFSEDATTAKGSYYTDRHRTTVGTMTLNKEN